MNGGNCDGYYDYHDDHNYTPPEPENNNPTAGLQQLITIRELLRNNYILGDLRFENGEVFFKDGDREFKIDAKGDIHAKGGWNRVSYRPTTGALIYL